MTYRPSRRSEMIQLTSQEIQVLAEGLDGVHWSSSKSHAQSAAKKLFKQAERFDPALTDHLVDSYPQTTSLARE
jgi:predicted DNA-binding transcriptional regulator YafY